MQKKTVMEKIRLGGCELCRGGALMGKMRGEKVNYAEEDTEGEDGGSEPWRRGQGWGR